MCSRYELNTTNLEHISRRFGASSPSGVAPQPEIRPTNQAPVIKIGGQFEMLRWGLENSWDGKPLINARSETLAEKKTFIPLLENRCLVPATAYFEWREDNQQRIKTHIEPVNLDLIAFAGLFDGDSFIIITCAPSSAIAHIHGRMPVILERHFEQVWLTEAFPFAQVRNLLAPYPNGSLLAREIKPPPQPQRDLFY